MKNNFFGEIIISLMIIALLVFFVSPLSLLMPSNMHPFMVPLLVVLFIIFAGFLLKEVPGDERDQLHRLIASRFAYFAGIATLVLGIIIQSIHSSVDPWLIFIVCIILLAKVLGLVYGYLKH